MAPSRTPQMPEHGDMLQMVVCRALCCKPEDVQRVDCGSETSGSVAHGFLSSCGSMTVEAQVRGRVHELHLFVKREDPAMTDVLDGLDSFKRESVFYNTLLPHLEKAWRRGQPKDAPSTSDLGPAAYLGTDSMVVMEDLTRRGYCATGDWVGNGLDYEIVGQVLRALARVHAAGLVAEHVDGVRLAELAPQLLDETFFTRRPGSIGRQIFDVGAKVVTEVLLPAFMASKSCGFSDAVPRTDNELHRLQHLTNDAYLTLDMDTIRRGERVLLLTHGDAWPNNVLLHRDSKGRTEHAALVDFQMIRMAPPAFDVVMFLYVSLRRAARRKHMDGLLRDYYRDLDTFTRQRGLDLSEILSLDDFLASAARMSLPCRAMAATYMPTLAAKGDDLEELFKDSASRSRFMMEPAVRISTLAKWFESQGDEYRQHLRERVEDLLDLPPVL